jgi:hypothetical protein
MASRESKFKLCWTLQSAVSRNRQHLVNANPIRPGTRVAIRNLLKTHEVHAAREMGWSTLSNGELLRAAEDAGFDVLLTTDTNLPYQQAITGRTLAVVILSKNRWTLSVVDISDH